MQCESRQRRQRKAIEAELEAARSGSSVLRPCTAPRELTSAQARLTAAHPGSPQSSRCSPARLEAEREKMFRDHFYRGIEKLGSCAIVNIRGREEVRVLAPVRYDSAPLNEAKVLMAIQGAAMASYHI